VRKLTVVLTQPSWPHCEHRKLGFNGSGGVGDGSLAESKAIA
jgi:hypothetical protein